MPQSWDYVNSSMLTQWYEHDVATDRDPIYGPSALAAQLLDAWADHYTNSDSAAYENDVDF